MSSDDAGARRSSRKRNSKSALELLGLKSPKEKKTEDQNVNNDTPKKQGRGRPRKKPEEGPAPQQKSKRESTLEREKVRDIASRTVQKGKASNQTTDSKETQQKQHIEVEKRKVGRGTIKLDVIPAAPKPPRQVRIVTVQDPGSVGGQNTDTSDEASRQGDISVESDNVTTQEDEATSGDRTQDNEAKETETYQTAGVENIQADPVVETPVEASEVTETETSQLVESSTLLQTLENETNKEPDTVYEVQEISQAETHQDTPHSLTQHLEILKPPVATRSGRKVKPKERYDPEVMSSNRKKVERTLQFIKKEPVEPEEDGQAEVREVELPVEDMEELSADQQLAKQVLSALAAGSGLKETRIEGGVAVYEVQVQDTDVNDDGNIIFHVVNEPEGTQTMDQTIQSVESTSQKRTPMRIKTEKYEQESPQGPFFQELEDGSQMYTAAYFKERRLGDTPSNTRQHVMTDYLQTLVAKLTPADDWNEHSYVELEDAGGVAIEVRHCNYCHMKVHDRRKFRIHLNKHPEVDYKPWKCPKCDYRSGIKAGIARHINIHSDKKPYYCGECGKGFNFKQKMVLHMKYHLDIRDCQCPHCDMAFHEYKTLKNHLWKIHKDSSYPVRRGARKTSLSDLQRIAAQRREQGYIGPKRVAKPAIPAEETAVETPDTAQEVETVASAEQITEAEGNQTESQEQNDETAQQEETKQTEETVEEEQTEEAYQETSMTEQTLLELPFPEPGIGSVLEKKRLVELNGGKAPKTPRQSILHGTRKTLRNTLLYRTGQANNMDTMTNEAKAALLGLQMEKPKLARNRKSLHPDSLIETCLLEHCTMETDEYNDCALCCVWCTDRPMKFTTKTGFISHLEKEHKEVKAWACNQCDYKTRMRTSLLVHLKLHTGVKDFNCEICGKSFSFKQKLKNHMKHHLNLREFGCNQCEKKFNERGDLMKHIKRVHCTDKPHPCNICGKNFPDRVHLRRHMEVHADVRVFKCQHCNKNYSSKMSLNQHMKSHTCMFHCEICDKSFGSYSGFMAHKVMHDESYEGYKCDMCDKILHTKGSLTRHRLVTHSSNRPWACNQCDKIFKTKKDVKHHAIVHTTAKNFACTVCDYRCKRIESLRIHMRRHDDVKPYTCGECGKEYTQRRALQNHLQQHTKAMPLRCNLCWRNFQTQAQLATHVEQKHQKTLAEAQQEEHKSMTVFMCEECNSVFLSQDSLAVHILAEHMKQGFIQGMKVKMSSSDEKAESGDAKSQAIIKLEESTGVKVVHQTPSEVKHEGSVESTIEVCSSDAKDDFSDAVETLVTISDPSNKGRKVVSLLQPATEASPEESQTQSQVENPDDKFATLMNPQQTEGTYVIMDNQQEMLVPASSIDTLLAVSEGSNIENQEHTFVIQEDGREYVLAQEGGMQHFVLRGSDQLDYMSGSGYEASSQDIVLEVPERAQEEGGGEMDMAEEVSKEGYVIEGAEAISGVEETSYVIEESVEVPMAE